MQPFEEGFTVEWFGRPGLLAGDQGIAQCLKSHFLLFQQAKACPHDITRRPVTPSVDLFVDKGREVIS